jgi:hypothetical protein
MALFMISKDLYMLGFLLILKIAKGATLHPTSIWRSSFSPDIVAVGHAAGF